MSLRYKVTAVTSGPSDKANSEFTPVLVAAFMFEDDAKRYVREIKADYYWIGTIQDTQAEKKKTE